MGKDATASCGIIIAHYKSPLKFVLDKAREMEKKAKEQGRDRFAISFLRHSGEEKIGISKWKYNHTNLDTIQELEYISELFQKKDNQPWLSKNFINKFNESFKRLKDSKGNLTVSPEIFNTELQRIVARSLNGVNNNQKKAWVEKIVQRMKNLFWNYKNIDNFLNLIYIAYFIKNREESYVYKN